MEDLTAWTVRLQRLALFSGTSFIFLSVVLMDLSFFFFFFAGRREEVEFFLPLMNFNRGDKSVLLMIRSLSLDVSRGYSLATIFRLGLE